VLVVLAVLAWARFGPEPSPAPWQATVDLSRRGDGAFSPRVGVDRRGDALAVWTATTRKGLIVQSATRAAGGRWGGPVDLSAGSRNAQAAELAVGAQGTVVAVWESSGIAYVRPRVVLAAVREPGEDWQAAERLSPPAGAADAPQVAVDEQGNAIAVWTAHRARGSTRVQSSIRPRGGSWQPHVDIAKISVPSHGGLAEPRIAVDARGNALAVWTDLGADLVGRSVVQSALRRSGRGWEAPVDMSPARHDSGGASAAFDARGNAIVAWGDFSDRRVRSATRPPGGTWAEPVDVFDENLSGGHLAVSPRGDEIVAWNSEAMASLTDDGR